MALKVLLILLAVLGTILLLAEVLVPIVTGNKLFPSFRRNKNTLLKEIRDLNDKLEEKDLEKEIGKKRSKLNSGPGTVS